MKHGENIDVKGLDGVTEETLQNLSNNKGDDEYLEAKGFKLDEKEVDIAIESAVLEMQNAIAC